MCLCERVCVSGCEDVCVRVFVCEREGVCVRVCVCACVGVGWVVGHVSNVIRAAGEAGEDDEASLRNAWSPNYL